MPRCCRVYEDFWQDINMQCSEDVLLEAAHNASLSTADGIGDGAPLYAWRFDQVQDCPPALSGWPGPGYGKPSHACFHTMDLSWMFGTISTFWDWERPPGGAQCWNCSWPASERAFSNSVIRAWVHVAATGRMPEDAAWPTWEPSHRRRLNLRISNTTALAEFRQPFCDWWRSAYARLRAASSSAIE